MPVTLKQVTDHLVAMDELEPAKARSIAREVIAVLGLFVDARNDEVYNPAPRSAVPEQRNVRYAGMKRRRF